MAIRRNDKKDAIALLVAAVIIVLVLIGAWTVDSVLRGLSGTRTESVGLATVSHRTDVSFPSSAKLVHSLAINHGIDYELYAEVEIDRNDLGALVTALKKQPDTTLSRKDRLHVSNSLRNWRQDVPVPEWWKPDSSHRFIACYTYLPLLLISLDDPNKATVWVHYDTDGPPR